ncbi:MAG TPA: hypothetical protein VFI42_16665 [Thermomicrobiaceae bacterium]|nr:hypothetical protein [Thermomicrobiaceae bacterium]
MPAEHDRRLQRLAELATLPGVPVGTRVYVVENDLVYRSAGTTRPEIAARLSWTQANVWMPDDRIEAMREKRVFPDPVVTANLLLRDPDSVHLSDRGPNMIYFLARGAKLRMAGALTSSSTRYVDLVVELRVAGPDLWLRLFHLSPTGRNKGGRQVWP